MILIHQRNFTLLISTKKLNSNLYFICAKIKCLQLSRNFPFHSFVHCEKIRHTKNKNQSFVKLFLLSYCRASLIFINNFKVLDFVFVRVVWFRKKLLLRVYILFMVHGLCLCPFFRCHFNGKYQYRIGRSKHCTLTATIRAVRITVRYLCLIPCKKEIVIWKLSF